MTDRIDRDAIRERRQGQSLQQEPNYWQGQELMAQRQDLKLQGSPIAERRAQSQEQRDDDRSH
jgi:hypothetical protein